jgi:isoleucyl-tRNA synthetase
MKFDQLKDNFSWTDIEKAILQFWDQNRIFEKSLEQTAGGKQFIFFEGPPTANGQPGIHHVIGRAIKDLICRYKTMQGFLVDRKAGWDTHGLPVEVEVEKKLKLKTKQQIREYGIARFNQKCRESVFVYKEDWDKITRRIGYWLDLDKAYITLENSYIESVWHILANFFDRGLIYLGHKTVPFCPRCETALSSHEVSQAYQDVSDPSVFVRMKAADADFSYLVWTTTPWTLPSNAAICLHPDQMYVRVRYQGEELVLAEELADRVLGGEFEVLDRKKGAEYLNRRYRPLFDIFPDHAADAYYAITAEFVTMEDGTGIVHIAPGFGADDYEIGLKYGLPVLQAIHENGVFKDDAGWLAGMFVKDADPKIIADLDKRGLLLRSETFTHTYPFCWRCDSPLIYIARKSWYIRTTQFKDKLLANNRQINWYPPEIGSGRFGEWLENNVDWALSRERFWGTPLPIWVCQECDAKKAIGSVADLHRHGIDVPPGLDLHKPHIDEIELTCPSCSGRMKRVPEVIDVWFDSGAMPFAQWHYPFEHKDDFDRLFPAEFISEAVDQTRGWFYSLLAISTLYYDKPCFANCLVVEFVVDKEGKKMSKHVGNVIDPFDMVGQYGADAVRWYMIVTSHPWVALKFDPEGVAVVQRKFFDTFKNCYAFWCLYANIDDVADKAAQKGMSVGEYLRSERGPATLIDRWVWSRYNSIVSDVTAALDGYNLTRATRLIQDFVIDDLSNWYIRLNRSRFYGSGDDPDKMLVYSTLYDVLVGVCRLMSPIAPFFSEYVYRQLLGANRGNEPESVHLTCFPKADVVAIDTLLETEMDMAKQVVSLALAGRKRKNLKVRQPLSRIIVGDGKARLSSAAVEEVILKELNIRSLEFSESAAQYVSLTAKPVFSRLGPKFGKQANAVAERIKAMTGDEIKRFQADHICVFETDGRRIELAEEDVEIVREERAGFAVESDGTLVIAIDTTLTPELIDEGFARELVNKVQNMRKTSGFEVTDKIRIKLFADEPLAGAAGRFERYICAETLAVSLERAGLGQSEGNAVEWSINGEKAAIAVKRL